MSKRSNEDKIMNTKEVVLINGKELSPTRYTVYQTQGILNEAREKAKKISALRVKALKLGGLAQKGQLDNVDIADDTQREMLEQALELQTELEYEMNGDMYNFDLIKRAYPTLTEGDLEVMTEAEYEAAAEAIFEVNPSLKKVQAVLLGRVSLMDSQTT
ncbi:hypothetical protein [Deinococcus sp. Leaf326]|uniref:hypothetical protein n=1 Tax=Deinococcus sp. Leaf326 TaxID=1736338 RepID=UPI0006F7AC59|nr:hypothetical protein [Deinococcus sp. Leaf326]KQR08834.1 hypothetical protein ASF71_10005 [Deinococcus sp. Leaf326]